ncbi:hypothetical protein BD413DRAFT_246814 [Trametes elegans]|nr:hypothetical protein BD413DRAFT_246814 [Trametes elegans]
MWDQLCRIRSARQLRFVGRCRLSTVLRIDNICWMNAERFDLCAPRTPSNTYCSPARKRPRDLYVGAEAGGRTVTSTSGWPRSRDRSVCSGSPLRPNQSLVLLAVLLFGSVAG